MGLEIRMRKTFKEKAISRFTGIARRHKILKYPCLALLSMILGVYYIVRHFATNGKRYASIAFVLAFFMNIICDYLLFSTLLRQCSRHISCARHPPIGAPSGPDSR